MTIRRSVAALAAVLAISLIAVKPGLGAGIVCGGEAVTIVGSSAADTLSATPANDVIHGRGGDDTITGWGATM
jgi:Ca2+-binding RTX toxin-like protein